MVVMVVGHCSLLRPRYTHQERQHCCLEVLALCLLCAEPGSCACMQLPPPTEPLLRGLEAAKQQADSGLARQTL